jgi:hypothetical protein
MQHEIDLGDEIKLKVKYAGQEFQLREPTVGELDAFKSENLEDSGATFIADFLAKLGMPKDIVLNMGMSKARQLVDGLMDMLTKKK